jgi:hypothetical protein
VPFLVEPPPAESSTVLEAVYTDYVVLLTAPTPFQEGQICSFLEANGIPTQIHGEGIRRIYGFAGVGFGTGDILVPRELEAKARDLLARADRGELQIDADNSGTDV